MRVSKVDFLPIFILGGFNFLTLMMYIFSPFEFLGGNPVSSMVYVFINISFLFFGYFVGLSFAGRLNTRKNVLMIDELKAFKYLFFLYAFTFFIRYAYVLRYDIFDWVGMFQQLSIGWFDPKLGYQLAVSNTRPFTLPWSVMFFVSIFDSLFFISGAIVWGKINVLYKFSFVVFIVLEILFWYGRGTNFGIILLIVILFFSNLTNVRKINTKLLIKMLVVFFIGLVAFSTLMSFRAIDSSADLSNFGLYATRIKYDYWLFYLLPDNLHPVVLMIFSYIVQGYYFLSFAFDLDYKFTYFVGYCSESMNFASNFGLDVKQDTYINRLEALGIDPLVNWHSAYLWFASDLTFYFVPLLIFVIGFMLAMFWVLARKTNDHLYKILFVIFSGIVIFLFSNTNIISYYFFSLIVILPLSFYKILYSLRR